MIWQDADTSGCSIDVDEWWKEVHVDAKILEAVIFKNARVEPVLANKIAPWIPPSCRGHVINTEQFKSSTNKVENSSIVIGH